MGSARDGDWFAGGAKTVAFCAQDWSVYALGITLLELLLNRSPFEGMSPVEALRAKIRHQFVPVDLDRWVQDLLSKATHPTPELRFQSMQEFKEAIESKHISYVFDRSRVQAHALAAKAEKLLAR
jgi:serine/threonine protein kinase